METVYVVDAVRTAVGRYGGALSAIRPDDLLAKVIVALVKRNGRIDVNDIEDVIAGDANQAGEDNRNVARMAALLAGLPVSVAGNTVNRLCASGLQAIMDASRAIKCGDGNIYLAGGVESMSRAPFVMSKSENAFSRKAEIFDTTIGWRFPQKYFAALAAGKWKSEIIPVEIKLNKKDTILFGVDEHPRNSALEKLSQLKPAFTKDGTVTAGNSSGINDGAAMLMLANERTIEKYDLKPMARIVSMAVAGVDPAIMGIGPVAATKKALLRAGLTVSDLDLIELNEAFASQSIACIHDLGLDIERVNVNGGAIAIGHPLGCSGARIATTLLYELKRRKARYGLATMCVGVGQGAAMVFENMKA